MLAVKAVTLMGSHLISCGNPGSKIKSTPESSFRVGCIYMSTEVEIHSISLELILLQLYGTIYCVLLNRGSYMSAYVLLNLLNELGKRDKMRGLTSILSLFRNEFNKFKNTRARMLDSIYHMTNTLKSYFWRKNVIIL